MHTELLSTRARVEVLESQLRTLGELRLLLAQVDDIVQRLNSVQVNQELLKGEIRRGEDDASNGSARRSRPARASKRVGVRFAELRERVYGLERRLRTIVSSASEPGAPGGSTSAPSEARAAPAGDVVSDLFDYAGFEQRFRGDPAVVLEMLEARYLDVLATLAAGARHRLRPG